MVKWLEIGADFACNNRCRGCFSVAGDGASMTTREIFATLRRGRAAGAAWLWLGGGEPTLRKDLFTVVAEARRLGFTRIKLQTNGMLLSYPSFAERCANAGVGEVNFAIKGSTAAIHDALTRTPGCFDLMVRGMAEWRRFGLPADGDVLLYRDNLEDLPRMIEVHTRNGVERFNLWLFSASDAEADLSSHVPPIREIIPFIAQALALGLGRRRDFISSLHTPPCTVPAALSAIDFRAADLDLLVADPGGSLFRLETSPIEGGLYLDRCAACALRPRCAGVRRDYLAIHGDEEFQPVRIGAPPRRLPLLRDVVGAAASASAPGAAEFS